MEQRITRAKAKIKTARIPYRVPSAQDLPDRVFGVLAVLLTEAAVAPGSRTAANLSPPPSKTVVPGTRS